MHCVLTNQPASDLDIALYSPQLTSPQRWRRGWLAGLLVMLSPIHTQKEGTPQSQESTEPIRQWQAVHSISGVFWPCHVACRILGPQPGIKPVPSAVESRSPNHWTAKEVFFFFLTDFFFQTKCYREVEYITWSKVSDWDLHLGFRNLRMKTPRLLQPPCTLGNRLERQSWP